MSLFPPFHQYISANNLVKTQMTAYRSVIRVSDETSPMLVRLKGYRKVPTLELIILVRHFLKTEHKYQDTP